METFKRIVLWMTNQIKYLVMFCILGLSVSLGALAGETAQTHGVPIWVSHMISGGVALAVPSLLIWAMASFAETINKGFPHREDE